MNEKSERGKLSKLYHVLAPLEFFIFLAGKSTSQMNYSVSKHMFAACRDEHEQLDIVKESLLLSEKSIHKDTLCNSGGCAAVLCRAPTCFSPISHNVATSILKNIHESE